MQVSRIQSFNYTNFNNIKGAQNDHNINLRGAELPIKKIQQKFLQGLNMGQISILENILTQIEQSHILITKNIQPLVVQEKQDLEQDIKHFYHVKPTKQDCMTTNTLQILFQMKKQQKHFLMWQKCITNTKVNQLSVQEEAQNGF